LQTQVIVTRRTNAGNRLGQAILCVNAEEQIAAVSVCEGAYVLQELLSIIRSAAREVALVFDRLAFVDLVINEFLKVGKSNTV
jgi:hypothetical protein